MTKVGIAYVNPYTREDYNDPLKKNTLVLNAWVVQNIVYELIKIHLITNDPAKQGFSFKQRYNVDSTKSDIYLDLAYNWNASVVNKRPAVVVQRGQESISHSVFSNTIGSSVMDSLKTKQTINTLPILISCIATNVGFVEQFSDYIKMPLLHHGEEIYRDFGFRKFRLLAKSAPELVAEAKDYFRINLQIETSYDEMWKVIGDDLKLKTVSKTIFNNLLEGPLKNQ